MKKQKKIYTFLLSLLLAFSLLFPGSIVPVEAAGGDMAVHFIDVGQGLAILVQSGGENLLYDGGNRSHADGKPHGKGRRHAGHPAVFCQRQHRKFFIHRRDLPGGISPRPGCQGLCG